MDENEMDYDENESDYQESELQYLLGKNRQTIGLSVKQRNRAYELISIAEPGELGCLVCHKNKEIYDTGICKDHARWDLINWR